jgi:hypothetical protein
MTNGRRQSTIIVAFVLLCAGATAHADSITIIPTFDSSITGLPNAGSVESAINAGIAVLEADIGSPNNITVSIDFQNMSSGLGGSETGLYSVPYYYYYYAYQAVATSSDQLTALASLGAAPTGPGSGNPVNGNTQVDITSAEGRNLGFNTPGFVPVGSGTYDGVIGLNTSITSPPNSLSGNYGLEAVALHEMDEVLGIGGTSSTLDGTGGLDGAIGDLDLYRYSAPGVRSYSNLQTTSPYSYFSIDGGATVLSYFNQTSGADLGDWLSNPIPTGFGPQVQDAFGEPGTDPSLGANELTAFNVIGYEVPPASTPEPSTLFLSGSVLAIMAGIRRRRHGGSFH